MCSRLYGTGSPMKYSDASYDPELLKLMTDALDAAWGDRRRSWDDIASRAPRTAMAFQIMTAVGAGERDPERLKLAALNATAGRTLDCNGSKYAQPLSHHRDLLASRLRSRTRRWPAAKRAG